MKVITIVLVSIRLTLMDNEKIFSLIIEKFSYDSSTLIVRRYGINWDAVLLHNSYPIFVLSTAKKGVRKYTEK